MPDRIQLSRKPGSRKPEGAVNVGRHGKSLGPWGNPFRVGHKVICPGRWDTEASPYDGDLPCGSYDGSGTGHAYEIRLVRDRADAVALYTAYYSKTAWNRPEVLARIRRELGGKDLACWCPRGEPCHADVLLELANPAAEPPGDGERWLEVLACCPSCSVVMQVLWNGCGEPECESCGRPLMVSVIREATAEQIAQAMEAHDG